MAKAYYSTVLDHSADEVWSVIRMFDHYSWAGVKAETIIEDGRKGDQVGSVFIDVVQLTSKTGGAAAQATTAAGILLFFLLLGSEPVRLRIFGR